MKSYTFSGLTLVVLLWSTCATAGEDRAKCVLQLNKLFAAGVNPASAFGFHGTGVEVVLAASDTGKLPVQGSGDPSLKDSIYIFGNPKSPDLKKWAEVGRYALSTHVLGNETPFRGAEGYANDVGRRLRFLTLLNLPSTPENIDHAHTVFQNVKSAEEEAEWQEHVHYFMEQAKLDQQTVTKAIRQAAKTEGIILGFGAEILNDNEIQVEPAIAPDDGIRIYAPKGIPIEYLLGIEPLGQYEYDVLDALSND